MPGTVGVGVGVGVEVPATFALSRQGNVSGDVWPSDLALSGPSAVGVEDLFPENVAVSCVSSELPDHVQVDPTQGHWSSSVVQRHVV